MSQPTLTTAIYDGAYVRAFWNYPGAPPSSYILQTSPTSGSNPVYTKKNIGNEFGAVPITSPLVGAYQVQVAAVLGSSPVWSQGMLLLTTLPQMVMANYDGKSVAVSWKPIPDANPKISSWTVKVYVPSGGGETYTVDVDDPNATSAILNIPKPLVPPSSAENYAVQVCANTSYGASTCMAPVTLNTALPILSSAIYDGKGIQVFWTDKGTQQEPIIGFRVTVLDSKGNTVADYQKKGSPPISYTLDLPEPLDPQGTFHVQVSNYTATNIYTSTQPTRFETALPKVLDAVLENIGSKLSLNVDMEAIAYSSIELSAYSLIVYSPSVGQPYTTKLTGLYPTAGVVDLSNNWNASNQYFLQIVADSSNGIVQTRSAPLALLTALPGLLTAQYNGKKIKANWKGVPTQSVSTSVYQVSVLDNSKNEIYNTTVSDPNASEATINIPSPLIRTAAYFLKVSALSNAIGRAASNQIRILNFIPTIRGYKVSTTSLSMTWDRFPRSVVPVKSLTIALVNKDGDIIFSNSKVKPNSLKGTLTFPSVPDLSVDLYAALIAYNIKGVSSISEFVKVNIINWAPEITNIVFENDNAIIDVQLNPSSQDSITSYEIDLLSNGNLLSTTPVNHFGSALNLPFKPKAGVSYSTKVRAISNAHSISLSSNLNTILVVPVNAKKSRYNGKRLDVFWDNSKESGVTGYLVSVLSGTQTIASILSKGTVARINVPLERQGPYDVVVQAVGANTVAPIGSSVPVISDYSEIISANYDSSTNKLEVKWSPFSQATSYEAQLYKGHELIPNTPTYNGEVATFDITLDPQFSYSVRVRGINGDAVGRLSHKAHIITSAPKITSVSNTNNILKVSWDPTVTDLVDGYLVSLFNKAGAIPITEANYTGTNSIELKNPLTGNAPFTVQVQGVNDVSIGPMSMANTIISAGVMINTLTYDGKVVTGSWTDSTEVGVTSYIMSVRDQNSVIAQVSSAGSTASVNALLDPNKSYVLDVQPCGLNSLGPILSGPSIYTSTVKIKSVEYDNTINKLTVKWDPATNATSYVAKLFQDDIEVNSTPKYSADSAVFDGPFDEWANYHITVTPVYAIATGVPSASANALVAHPVITQVSNIYNQVSIEWTPLSNEFITGYLVTLFNKSGAIAITSANYTESNSIVLDNPLTGKAPFMVQVQAVSDKGKGPLSKAVTIISAGVMVNTLAYDGKSVSGSWNNSTEGGVTGYLMTVRDGNFVIAQVESQESTASVNALLDPSKMYTLEVQALGQKSIGPIIAGPDIFTQKTQIKSVVYDESAKKLTCIWNPITGSTAYIAKLIQGDIETGIQPTYNKNKAVFDGELNSWGNYQVIVQAKKAIATGPPSLPANVITAAPKINFVKHSNNQITVYWTPLIDESISGYLVTMFNKSGAIAPAGDNYSETNSIVMKNALSGSAPYSVQVQAVNDKGLGPASPLATIIGNGLMINTLSYDGKSVTGNWTNSTEAGVTGYIMSVKDGNSTIAKVPSAGSTATVEASLDPSKSYTLEVQPTGLNTIGPIIAGPNIFTAQPQIKSAVYDNIANTLTVEWNPVANATSFIAELYLEDIKVDITPAYNGNKAIFTGALNAWANYRVIVQAKMAIATGPASQHADIITAGPLITDVKNVDGTVTLEWEELAGRNYTGYLVTLTNTKTSDVKTYHTEGTSFSVSGAVTGTDPWKAQVQAINDKAIGPFNENKAYRDIITQKVTITDAKYNGQTLVATWNDRPSPVIGYYLNIYDSYVMLHSAISSGTSMAVPVELDPSETYTVLMQAAGENSIGPLGNSIQLITEAPVIESITYDDNQKLTVTWAAVSWANSFKLHLYNEDIEITSFSPSYPNKTSGSGTIALDETKVYNVRVEGIKGKVTGPLSAPEYLISAKPKLKSTSYQSGSVLVSWDGIGQDVVNGYNIGVFESGNETPLAQKAFPVKEGAVPYTLTEGTSYEVKVQAIGNKSVGPWSSAMNPWQVDAGYYFSEYVQNIQPYLFRTQNVPPAPLFDFKLYLPQIFNEQPATLPSGVTSPTNPNSPFVMSVNGTDKTLPYVISVGDKATNDTWNFAENGPPIRTELSDDYDAFITALSTVNKGMLPGTIPYLNQVIARGLPLTYAETLYYAYGFNPTKRYVSLQAGMRITLSYSEYQFIGPGGTSPLLNGYVGSGSVSYIMGSYLSGSSQETQKLDIGFSNFLNHLALETHSNVGGGSSVLDTYITGASEPYYRIFYPTSFLSADDPGSVDPSQNISIVIASDFSKMKAATDAWNNSQPFPGDVLVLFLRGRATIVPEIKITLSGQEQWVPIGTTLRNVLDEYASVPFRPTTGSTDGWQTTNIKLTRTIDSVINAVEEVETAYSIGRSNPIAISHAKIVCYTNGQDNFDLPLLQGDHINLINQD
ncbi:MAG: fibronectin type III domain-containing protein [Bacteroidota bacterium]